jgi:hypothetical protein
MLFAFFAAVGAKAQDPLISEFMASNSMTLADEDGEYPDWVEIYNPATTAVSLNGWYLTDNEGNLVKWQFPGVSIPAGGFRVVFASGKNRRNPSANLHTNFKLDADGEYIALVKPDGKTVVSSFGPNYPPQQTDVSYGVAFNGTSTTLLASGAPVRALVPTSSSVDTTWMAPAFDDSSWMTGTTGVGFERGSGYESLIGLDCLNQMYGINATCYIRAPFNVANAGGIDSLVLRMKFDDGFVAYLNGTRVASYNAPTTLKWNSSATAINDDSLAVVFQDFDISAWKSSLVNGTNVLAIHGMNAGTTSSDFLIIPEIVASAGQGIQPGVYRYFTIPTPGNSNATATAALGPEITAVTHTPNEPAPGESLVVTAHVAPFLNPVSSVRMTFRVQYGAETELLMLDDGAHGDGAAGDGVYGATIPASAYSAGQMVRYFIKATDSGALSTRSPFYVNPTGSPQYYGTVVKNPAIQTPLPVLHWFVQSPSAADTETGTRASIYYNGQFYDNIFVRLRGQTSASWPKKHHKFELNGGFFLRYASDREPVDEFNLQSTYSDKSYIRQVLSWEAYEQAGVPGCFAFPVRVQQNGNFYSVAVFMEQPDGTMLTRLGLDADGAQYKMYNECTSAYSGVEKKSREWEDNSDLQALINGINLTGQALHNYLFDNVDIPESINYLAATSIMHDNDHVGKNYLLYRDTEGNKEWKMLPWDKDLTYGRNFVPWDGGVLSDEIWANNDPYSHPFFGNRTYPKVDGPWNRYIDAIYRDDVARQMYLRRLRTLMDQQLQPPETPAGEFRLNNRIDQLVSLIQSDVILDRAKWGNPYGANQDLPTAIGLIKNSYLPRRRTHLYYTHSAVSGLIPLAQTGVPALTFGQVERSPASGNQDEEYIEVVNPGTESVDISGWKLTGDITFTFAPGTVLLPNSRVYVSPDVNVFRARSSKPYGGMGLFIQGNYRGHLSVPGKPVQLTTPEGTIVATLDYGPADLQNALRAASGLLELTPADAAWLNIVSEGESAAVVDMADATALARRVLQ